MYYQSTRGHQDKITGSQAVIKGMSEDGGLFVPQKFPQLSWENVCGKAYPELVKIILSLYFPEFTEDQLNRIVRHYNKKFTEKFAPVRSFGKRSFLELYHGPTASFKDMALTVLAEIVSVSHEVNNLASDILVLVATSGDTGSAALHGFAGQEHAHINVFYPTNGVSEIQMRQMEAVNQPGAVTYAIEGNFDDAQKTVKELFSDSAIKTLASDKKINIMTANSINIARLISQIAYYFYSYDQLVNTNVIKAGESIDIAVPTGNFGDILAGIYAKQMGLPIEGTICASNSNNVLTDFFHTGVYNTNRDFVKTYSPSMDILISSNLERFLHLISSGNSQMIKEAYNALNQTGQFTWSEGFPEYLQADFSNDEQTLQGIQEVFVTDKYLIDPHTAVAYQASKLSTRHCLVVSTASPYKFVDPVLQAIQLETNGTLQEKIYRLAEVTGTTIPESIVAIANADIQPKHIIDKTEIKDRVKELLEKR